MTLPELGRNRCYWVILDSSLNFKFLDPILYQHLNKQASLFLQHSILDFIHPSERDSMQRDLMGGSQGTNGVFGSVTRCMYSNVNRIRRILGEQNPSPAVNPLANQEYIDLSITTSWVGGSSTASNANERGCMLAFFHATDDKDPVNDSDESRRTAWTNWCGPHVKDGEYLTPERCRQLGEVLATVCNSAPPTPFFAPFTSHTGPPPHVFQILGSRNEVIFSFPRADGLNKFGAIYDIEEYATLAREVVARPRGITDASTSCTRRYRSKHPLLKQGALTTIESVIILYGAVTFAIYETGGVMLKAGSGTLETSPNPYSFSASPSFESNAITAGAFELENVPSRGVKREIRDEASQRNEEEETKRQRTTGDTMMNTTPALSIAPPHPHHYIPSLYEDGTGEISPTVATASSIVRSFSSVLDPSLRPSRPLTAPLARATFATSPLSATFPPASYIYPSEPMTSGLGLDASAVSTQVGRGGANARSRSRTRSPVHPNVAKAKGATVSVTGGQAEKACTSCGTTNSPEWRKGPSSSKELCNACGLRYARSQAKLNKESKKTAKPYAALPPRSPPRKPHRQVPTSSSSALTYTDISSPPATAIYHPDTLPAVNYQTILPEIPMHSYSTLDHSRQQQQHQQQQQRNPATIYYPSVAPTPVPPIYRPGAANYPVNFGYSMPYLPPSEQQYYNDSRIRAGEQYGNQNEQGVNLPSYPATYSSIQRDGSASGGDLFPRWNQNNDGGNGGDQPYQ